MAEHACRGVLHCHGRGYQIAGPWPAPSYGRPVHQIAPVMVWGSHQQTRKRHVFGKFWEFLFRSFLVFLDVFGFSGITDDAL